MSRRADQVLAIGARFEGRLPAAVLASALEYVQYNEAGLALDMLCAQLVEYPVEITGDEYARLLSMESFFYPDASMLKQLARMVKE